MTREHGFWACAPDLPNDQVNMKPDWVTVESGWETAAPDCCDMVHGLDFHLLQLQLGSMVRFLEIVEVILHLGYFVSVTADLLVQ